MDDKDRGKPTASEGKDNVVARLDISLGESLTVFGP